MCISLQLSTMKLSHKWGTLGISMQGEKGKRISGENLASNGTMKTEQPSSGRSWGTGRATLRLGFWYVGRVWFQCEQALNTDRVFKLPLIILNLPILRKKNTCIAAIRGVGEVCRVLHRDSLWCAMCLCWFNTSGEMSVILLIYIITKDWFIFSVLKCHTYTASVKYAQAGTCPAFYNWREIPV